MSGFPVRAAAKAALLGIAVSALPVIARAAADPLAGSWLSTWGDGPPATGLVPSVWLDRHGVGYTVGGTFAIDLGAGGSEADDPGLALEMGACTGRQAFGADRYVESASARLHASDPVKGNWLAASVVRQTNVREGMLPLIGAGAWAKRGRFTFAMQTVQLLSQVRTRSRIVLVEGPRDTSGTAAVDRNNGVVREEDARLLTGVEGSVGWASGRLELQSRAGAVVALRQPPGRWAEMRVAYRTHPLVALFARARSATGVPATLETVRGTHAALGVQVAPGDPTPHAEPKPRPARPATRVEPRGDDRRAIIVHARGRTVEVSGDATGWSPVAANRVGPDTWEAVLTLPPGIHRIAMRVDGRSWKAPPGLPAADGEFGSEVGLVVIE